MLVSDGDNQAFVFFYARRISIYVWIENPPLGSLACESCVTRDEGVRVTLGVRSRGRRRETGRRGLELPLSVFEG